MSSSSSSSSSAPAPSSSPSSRLRASADAFEPSLSTAATGASGDGGGEGAERPDTGGRANGDGHAATPAADASSMAPAKGNDADRSGGGGGGGDVRASKPSWADDDEETDRGDGRASDRSSAAAAATAAADAAADGVQANGSDADALTESLDKLKARPKSSSDNVDGGDDDDDVDEPLPSKLAGRGLDEGDRTADVSVLQADPSTPYYSATSFEELGLSVELLQGVYAAKFNKPSKVQAVSLPMILAAPPKNLVAQAHNGSGKTACFVLGMLSRIDFARDQVQALCVVPTRELARQIRDVIMTLGKYTNVRVYCAVKQGEEEKRAGRVTNLTEHVVVGTPGRVMDLLRHRVFNAKAVKTLVLDEADEMIDTQGMGDQTLRIKKVLPRDVHTLLFSATYPEHVREFALKVVPEPNQITVKREQLSLDRVKQFYIDCGSDANRFQVLSDIYGSLQIGQSIIFVERRRDAAGLAVRMRNEGHSVSLLHGGDMTPEERDRVIDEFRGGTTKVLIATNVLARGVDVLATTIVINYDLPKEVGGGGGGGGAADPETYLHRVGRTGRFGRKGVAVNFVYDATSRRVLHEIEACFAPKCRIEQVRDVEALESILEDRSNFSRVEGAAGGN